MKDTEEERLVDLQKPGQDIRVARGGQGGRGNTGFATPVNRVPLLAEQGGAGAEIKIRLELQLLADVGILGKPNAGKSTLLQIVSGARPKIAAYPFTTLEPTLGVVETLKQAIVLLEIPGLISGAHEGAGLGLEFLRHVERTRVLIHLVDGGSEDPLQDFAEVRREMEAYQPGLLERPFVVGINKVDIPEVRQRASGLREQFGAQGVTALCIAAATREGVDALLQAVRELLAQAQALPSTAPEVTASERPVPVRPRSDERPSVRRENGVLVVESRRAARLAGGSDLRDRRAWLQFRDELRRLGVLRALEEAKVKVGDRVRLGEVELEWD